MPYWLNVINEKPDDAIAQSRKDTIQRAKDVWGLDYADSSDGLYPSGNQIGRTQFRPDQTEIRDFTVGLPSTNGGQWRTRVQLGPAGPIAAMVADANGWGTFFDFTLDDDVFIIIEGVLSTDTTPTVREIHLTLSGTSLPPMQIEEIYASEEETNKGYMEIPVVVSPKSQFNCRIRSSTVSSGIDEGFGILGEAIAKRGYLIKEVH